MPHAYTLHAYTHACHTHTQCTLHTYILHTYILHTYTLHSGTLHICTHTHMRLHSHTHTHIPSYTALLLGSTLQSDCESIKVLLQCVAGRYSVAVWCCAVQRVAACCSVLCKATASRSRYCCSVLQGVTVNCGVGLYVAVCCCVLQCVAPSDCE